MNNSEPNKISTIKFEMRYSYETHYSYFVDANGLLKGKWGHFEESNQPFSNGVKMYRICSSIDSKWIEISEYGYFYNLFSCQKYDKVTKIDDTLFLCSKNDRYGIININSTPLFHTCYKSIRIIDKEEKPFLFVLETETGEILYNIASKKMSLEFDSIVAIRTPIGQAICKRSGKFGLIDLDGNIMIPFICDFIKYATNWEYALSVQFLGSHYSIYVKNGLLYGSIPIGKYDLCVELRVNQGYIPYKRFISYKNSKYGIVSEKAEIICDTILDEIILFNNLSFYYTHHYKKTNTTVHIIFVIGKINNKYCLINAIDGTWYLKDCEEIIYVERNKEKSSYDYIKFKKNHQYGIVTSGGIVLDNHQYDKIKFIQGKYEDVFYVHKDNKKGILYKSGEIFLPCEYEGIAIRGKYYVNKNGKMGIIDKKGIVLLPCIYDKITRIEDSDYYIIEENGIEKKIEVEDLVEEERIYREELRELQDDYFREGNLRMAYMVDMDWYEDDE